MGQQDSGAVISLQDIDTLKRTLDRTREYADDLWKIRRDAVLLLDDKLRVTAGNRAFYRTFEVSAPETERELDLRIGQWAVECHCIAAGAGGHYPKKCASADYEVKHDFPKLGPRTMVLNARRVELQAGHPSILLAIEDVSRRSQQGVA